MSDWALVIGIDKYPSAAMYLSGAVNDALRMREWLVDPAGGAVPEANVLTALSPLTPEAGAGKATAEATKAGIVTLINGLLERSGGRGDRLFFYYAGHGLMARVNYSDENTLVLADFTEDLTDNSFTLRSLYEFFQTAQFADQYFFIDACRNMPWKPDREVVTGRWPLPRRRDPGQPPVQQFILYATSPGLKAIEHRDEVGNERGAFTEVLLLGLRGNGPAKAWCPDSAGYHVRWDGLVRFLLNEIEERKLLVGQVPARELFQIPQQDGPRGGEGREPNPTVVTFPQESFSNEKLEVFLEPDEVVSISEIYVIDPELAEAIEHRDQIPGLPVTFELPPRTYGLRVVAPEYEKARARAVELYNSRSIKLRLTKMATVDAPVEVAGAAAQTPNGSQLSVESSDDLATVQVADTTGRVVKVAPGSVHLDGLPAGFYRASVRTPEGAVAEQLIDLSVGEKKHVKLDSPGPPNHYALERVIRSSDLHVREDRAVQVPGVGAVSAPRLSTLLTLAGSLALQRRETPGLGALGVQKLADDLPVEAGSGLSVLIGVDAPTQEEANDRLSALRLRFWRFWENIPADGEAPTNRFSDVAGAAGYTRSAEEGQCWLSVEVDDRPPLVFALSLLPQRITMLVVQFDASGRLETFQYMPAQEADSSSDPRVLRQLELVQRVHLSTRLDTGFEIARELLHSKTSDPLAGCLGAYLFLRLGATAQLGEAVTQLATEFPQLSDVHVLTAEYEAGRGHTDRAEEAVITALDVGVPIFAEGLARLLDAIGEYQINKPSARLVSLMQKLHVPGSVWAVWTPRQFSPGGLLVP